MKTDTSPSFSLPPTSTWAPTSLQVIVRKLPLFSARPLFRAIHRPYTPYPDSIKLRINWTNDVYTNSDLKFILFPPIHYPSSSKMISLSRAIVEFLVLTNERGNNSDCRRKRRLFRAMFWGRNSCNGGSSWFYTSIDVEKAFIYGR